MGMLTGLWLRTRRSIPAKTTGLAAAAVVSLALGYVWALWFPLNKNMWTSSYVLVAGGYSLALVTLAFWAVEQKGWRTGWTWIWLVFGSNAIAAYMFSELLPGVLLNLHFTSGGTRTDVIAFVFEHVFAHIPDPGLGRVRLFGQLHRGLLRSGMAAVPQAHLPEGVTSRSNLTDELGSL